MLKEEKPDVIVLLETKCQELPGEIVKDFEDYHSSLVVSSKLNGGYAGVALLS